MRSKNDNMETMINITADEVIEELFQSLPCRSKTGFEISIFIYYIINTIK